MKISIIFFAFILLQSTVFSQQNWFHADLIKCIVSIEKKVENSFQFHGTGFLLYNYDSLGNDYVVTCEHVLKNSSVFIRISATDEFIRKNQSIKNQKIDFYGRIWHFDGSSLISEYFLIPDSTFFVNKDLDIGILKIRFPSMLINSSTKDTTRITSSTSIPRSLIKTRDEIKLGTEIYFLGFPFQIGTVTGSGGLYSNSISAPLLRTGTIAWEAKTSKEFLLDAFSYGGNSGSPVFTKRGVFGEKPYLIGMVFGHLSDPRLPGADINIGLARCVWMDDVLNLINKIETH